MCWLAGEQKERYLLCFLEEKHLPGEKIKGCAPKIAVHEKQPRYRTYRCSKLQALRLPGAHRISYCRTNQHVFIFVSEVFPHSLFHVLGSSRRDYAHPGHPGQEQVCIAIAMEKVNGIFGLTPVGCCG